jgi:ATP-dependent exoDNAse (exonuclease V) beta subunit
MENSASSQPTKTDLSSLNDRQRDAVISEEKSLLVLAGAGSGKTKTLLQKLVYLIEEKSVSPFPKFPSLSYLPTNLSRYAIVEKRHSPLRYY